MDDKLTYNFEKIQSLKYGENPHQEANLYHFDKELDWELIFGKVLSYNDILDSTKALEISAEFFDVACSVIVKHSVPSSVALANDIEGSFDKAYDSDPISPFDSVIAFNREITLSLARKISAIPFKVVLAPRFQEKALAELKKNKNLKIIQINTPYQEILKFIDKEIEITPFGTLIQEKNHKDLDVSTFKVISKKKPLQNEVEDMIFAFKIVKHVPSSAIVVAKDLRTIGICAGQTYRAQSVEYALAKVCDSPKDSVIASDGAINTIDNIQIAAQNRVTGIIQPANGIKDNEIIECANKLQLSMISTGIRHIKH